MLKFLCRLVVLLLLGSLVPDAAAIAADAIKAEIDGVQLYMSADEVLAALRQRFGADIAVNIAHVANKLNSTTQIVQRLEYLIENKYELTVRFAPRVPYDEARPEAAFAVVLVLRRGSDADQAALEKSIHEKYGPESGPGWCVYDATVPCLKILHELTDQDRGIEILDSAYEHKTDKMPEVAGQVKAPL